MIKKIVKPILVVIISLVIIFAAYMAYVLISYYRLEDNLSLEIEGSQNTAKEAVTTGETYRITSSNVGFGAYSDDYSFFMDGGTESWAFSEAAVNENIQGSAESVKSLAPDFYLFQEVDIDSTRSYHVNEKDLIYSILDENNNLNYVFAQNYDSPFLMYPFTQPHGKSKAGLLTMTSTKIQSAIRRSLPIEEGLSKLIDLDRCYSKSYIDVDNGKKLVLYNVHLSAYTTDPSTAENQVVMLNEDMLQELNAGNYIVAGGDMNKDMLGDSSVYFGTTSSENWAQPFPDELLDDSFTVVGPIDEATPVASCRNADAPYSEDSFVLTIDGFIVSNNVEVKYSNVYDTQFKYSDHNPVYMDFILK